jgi:ligand-binding sensor domain-containing protein/signal transduction histidine kinase
MAIVALVLLALVAVLPDALAQRLPLRAYSTADGLPGDQITALLPDSRGFLWIGTTTGLSRFDGREFRNYGVADGLPHPSVTALIEDRDGALWIGTRGGLVRIEPQGREMTPVPLGDRRASGVGRLLQTRDGRIWVAARQELFIFADERHRTSPEIVPLVLPTMPPATLAEVWEIESLVEGREGDVWIGTSWGLLRRLPDGRIIPLRVRPTAKDDRIYNLAVDREGRVWITHWGIAHRPGVHFGVYVLAPESAHAATSTDRAGAAAADATLHDRARQVTDVAQLTLPSRPGEAIYMTAGGPLGDARVQDVLPSDDGTVWIATEDGLLRVADGRATRYDERNGLGVPIWRVARDANGNVWLGTRGMGLARLEVEGFVTYAGRDGFSSGEVGRILEDATGALCLEGSDADGRHWFGTIEPEGLRRFLPRGTERLQYWGWGWDQLFLQDHTGEWWVPTGEGLFRYPASSSCRSLATMPPKAVYGRRDGLPSDEFFRAFEDSRGDIWLSVDTWPVRWVRATGAFETVSERVNPPTAFVEDRAGDVWIGFYHGGLARWRAGALRFFEPADGVPTGFIHCLFVDSQGRLWIGADPGGLARIDDPTAAEPRIVKPPADDGVTDISVNRITEDRQQRIYVATARGLVRFDPTLTHARRFSASDGLASPLIRTAYLDRRGQMWFGTQRGLSRLTPRPDQIPPPPPIFIDSLRVDGVPQPLSQLGSPAVSELTVGPETRRLEIGYGSPSLAPGETRRYQVRIHGVDPDWGAMTVNRTALYLNLAPGRYRFEARAVDADGLASKMPASVVFAILPPVWQRAWFQALVGLLIAAAGYVAYHSRVRHLLALERMRARIATDLHDDLGARLSRISILSEVAARRVSTDATSASHLLDEVGETARSLIEVTADITWAVDPRQDDLASLAARIRRFAADMFDARDIQWTFDAPLDGAAITLSPELRRHVLLVFQEAVNNVMRHARAGRVTLGLRIEARRLHASIEDDGCGFDAHPGPDDEGRSTAVDSPLAGRGLSNMAARARELGGQLTVASESGRGTRVHLSVPLR